MRLDQEVVVNNAISSQLCSLANQGSYIIDVGMAVPKKMMMAVLVGQSYHFRLPEADNSHLRLVLESVVAVEIVVEKNFQKLMNAVVMIVVLSAAAVVVVVIGFGIAVSIVVFDHRQSL